PRYSLKNVEKLHRPARGGDVQSGMESVVVYDAWRQAGQPRDWQASPLLRRIRDYNEEDCRSTFELVEWLRARQAEAGIAHQPGGPAARDDAETVAETEGQAARRARRKLAERMLAAVPADPALRARDAERWDVQELLAHLLEFHHREARPVWWELFELAGMQEEERFEQLACLAGLERTERAPFAIARSLGFEYRYFPQDTRIGEDDVCRLAQNVHAEVTVAELDEKQRRVVLKISPAKLAKAGLHALPARVCLIELEHRGARVIEEAIQAIAERFA